MVKIIELFAGIGACSSALDRLGIEHEIVDAVEIDKYAIASFNAIHGTNFEVQDICKWDKEVGEIDLIMHGSPCQDFSVAGKQAGGDEGSGTRSSLMYETLRIVRKVRPRYVIWENVKNLVSKKHKHNFDRYIEEMERIGYRSYWKVLNAKDYGVPQNRERVFTVSIRNDASGDFEFPKEQELKVRLKDVLEESVEEKYYLSDAKISSISGWKAHQKPFERVQGRESVCPTLTARGAGESKHQAGSIWDKEGLSPTLDTMQGGWRQPCVVEEPKVINPLKGKTDYSWQFEQQVYDADGIARSVKAGEGSGNIPKVVVVGNYMPSGHDASRIVDSEGIAPTVKENHGREYGSKGNVPIVVDSSVKPSVAKNFEREKEDIMNSDKERKDIKHIEKFCEYCGKQLERKRFNGRLEDFSVFQNRRYCDRGCMQKAFLKIGEYNQTYSNAHTTARKINELILHKEVCELCGGENNLDIHHIDGNWQNNNLDNLMCLCRSCHTKYERNKVTKVCKICGGKHKGLGYCNKHYIRYKKYGNPLYVYGKEEGVVK